MSISLSRIRPLADILSVVQLPGLVVPFLAGAAATLAVLARLPWHLQLLLYLISAAVLTVILYGIWAIFLYSKIDRLREVRSLLEDAAERLGQMGERPNMNRKEVLLQAFGEGECDILIRMSLKPHEVAKYETYIDISRWRAARYGKSFNESALKAEFFSSLAKNLRYSMIDPTFRPPETLDEFPGPGFMWPMVDE